MSTKGACNRYGNSRFGKNGHKTSHIGYAWAKGFNKNTLEQHFNDHGKQMGCSDITQYETKAVNFANNVDKKYCISFIDQKGSTHKFNRKTDEYCIISSDGIVVTYFKPEKGKKYYDKQKRNNKKRNLRRNK